MSHYPVLVRVSASRLASAEGDLEKALEVMLAPFEESPKDKRFLKFEDEEDGWLEDYLNGTTDRVRMEDGELVYPFDVRFRTKRTGADFLTKPSHEVPPHLERVKVPNTQMWTTFEAYCKDYHSAERDAETGRYGYWRNPNSKWDWYLIGGRWTGFFPLRTGVAPRVGRPGVMTPPPEAGRGDVTKIGDLDLDKARSEMVAGAGEFYDRYAAFVQKPSHGLDSPRSMALDLGLVRIERDESVILCAPEETVLPWSEVGCTDERRVWRDVLRLPSRAEFMETYVGSFNPLLTYAALNDEGWHAPGRMGWFGCSSESPDELRAWHRGFMGKFIDSVAADDTLVVVDCHI